MSHLLMILALTACNAFTASFILFALASRLGSR
jgi:hypothetical protein